MDEPRKSFQERLSAFAEDERKKAESLPAGPEKDRALQKTVKLKPLRISTGGPMSDRKRRKRKGPAVWGGASRLLHVDVGGQRIGIVPRFYDKAARPRRRPSFI